MDEQDRQWTQVRDNYEHLRSTLRSQASSFNQMIVAVSGVALGWSFTFMDKTLEQPPKYFPVLVTAWVAFFLSIAIIIVSLTSSVNLLDSAVKTEPAALTKLREGKLNKCIPTLNWISAGSSVGGIFLLVLFFSLNSAQVRSTQVTNPRIPSGTNPIAIHYAPTPGATVSVGGPINYSPQSATPTQSSGTTQSPQPAPTTTGGE